MKTKTRSLEQIIEEQVQRWEILNAKERKDEAVKPIITVSREPGSGGKIIAEAIADQLGLDFFHHAIIQKMAESANINERLLDTLDEKNLSVLDDWISTLVNERHLWPDQYLHHLLKVIGTIGRHGGAVLVGRGTSFIFPPGSSLRVRIVAPFETRVQNVSREFGVTSEEAKRRVLRTESDRRAFVRKYFHGDVASAVNYDLIINTGTLSVESAVKVVRSALGSD